MKICTCESCHYTFHYPSRARCAKDSSTRCARVPLLPPSCPDCGRKNVRQATKDEIREFHRMQAILAEEIRMGLYAAEAAAG